MRSLQSRNADEHTQDIRVPEAMPETSFYVGMWALVLLLLLSTILAAGVGAVHISSRAILSILLNRSGLTHLSQYWPISDQVILLHIRLPCVLASGLVRQDAGLSRTRF